MESLAGKVAVITGAASGLGLEFARVARSRGMHLVLADVQADALNNLQTEFAHDALRLDVLRCDVSQADEVERLADVAYSQHDAVHLVFNNAGVASGGLLWENTLKDWEWVLGVNLWGVVHGVRSFVPRMLESGKRDHGFRGHLINTASMAGLLNAPTMGVYNVSKHAVVSLSETLYQDLSLIDAPVGVSVLCPYFVPTAIHQSHRNRPDALREAAPATASQMAAQAMSEKAVLSGKVSAHDVALRTFDAVARGDFYIYSHPEALSNVRARMDDLLSGRNPGDPYATTPHVRAKLQQLLGKR